MEFPDTCTSSFPVPSLLRLYSVLLDMLTSLYLKQMIRVRRLQWTPLYMRTYTFYTLFALEGIETSSKAFIALSGQALQPFRGRFATCCWCSRPLFSVPEVQKLIPDSRLLNSSGTALFTGLQCPENWQQKIIQNFNKNEVILSPIVKCSKSVCSRRQSPDSGR